MANESKPLSKAEELRKSEERLLLATRIGKVGVWDWDINENTVYWSDSLYTIHGLKKEEFQYSYESFMDLVHPDDRAFVSDTMQKSLAEDAPYHFEFRAIKPDQSIIWLYTNALILRDDGKPARMLGATMDITERKEAEEIVYRLNNELEQRVKERTLLLEKQSGRLRALADQLVSTEQKERKRIASMLHDHLQQILVASQFQLAQISRKIKEGKFEEALECVDRSKGFLNEAINSARSLSAELRPPVLYEGGLIEALRWLARKFEVQHALKVTLDCEEIPISLSDSLKIMLFESIKELLFNIVKHAKVKEAQLRLHYRDNALHIYIEDRGAGFHLDINEKSASEQEGGFGLFSIRERFKLWNAQFDIMSRPNQGTRILIVIPIYPEEVKKELQPQVTRSMSPQQSVDDENDKTISILLVDDHKIVREGIANILKERASFQIIAQAENGVEAREKTAIFHPDVIIMDINMPQLNGIDATRLIKKDFPEVQIIGLSVQDEGDVSEAMKKAGAFTLLNKAGDPEDLIKAILECTS